MNFSEWFNTACYLLSMTVLQEEEEKRRKSRNMINRKKNLTEIFRANVLQDRFKKIYFTKYLSVFVIYFMNFQTKATLNYLMNIIPIIHPVKLNFFNLYLF